MSADKKRRKDPLVKIATAPNEPVALMWKGALEHAGISVMVKPTGPGFADYSITVCPHFVYVLASDEERARSLLEGLVEGEDLES